MIIIEYKELWTLWLGFHVLALPTSGIYSELEQSKWFVDMLLAYPVHPHTHQPIIHTHHTELNTHEKLNGNAVCSIAYSIWCISHIICLHSTQWTDNKFDHLIWIELRIKCFFTFLEKQQQKTWRKSIERLSITIAIVSLCTQQIS